MERSQAHRPTAWFQLAVGVAVVGWWTIAAVTNGIPELDEGRIDIVFHIAAELVMAALLIVAGVALHRRGRTHTTTVASGLALGALLYSTINSPGYFADRGEWWAIAMFAAIGAAATMSAVNLLRGDTPPGATPPQDRAVPAEYGRTQ